ncbi:MAG TPA: adenylosuccinate lyase [Candidatus Latescibacteria bacterium]|nr:adenylosuccinate lyase [Candidatus Latescibacterota bacterium]
MPNETAPRYADPLVSRYASPEMATIFADLTRFRQWRRLWIALAEAEKELGLPISEEQLAEMRAHAEDIDIARADELERKLRHDVMAHVHAFGEQCPGARPIIHLGATSCYVTDNSELWQIREGLRLLRARIVRLITNLADFARTWRSQPALGYTHFQPAQLTTVGKRATLWLHDFVEDLLEIEYRLDRLAFRGLKGTTGTQASFLELFDGDHARVRELEARVARKMGFERVVPVTGQTYSRKQDWQVLQALSGIAQSVHKFGNDIRLLQHLKEIEEPFGSSQIGSSAMAYKRNPMRSERATGLARWVLNVVQNASMTASEQWFERTLDDSANRRLAIPHAFLGADALLILTTNIVKGLVVYPAMIEQHIRQELPFMATENLLMAAVRAGGDRQLLHETIRVHSQAAGDAVKAGGRNDLLERLANDPGFPLESAEIARELEPKRFVGRAPEQVYEYLDEVVAPILAARANLKPPETEVKV